MHLDVPTLMAMGSFISACAGVVLFVAWWQNRKTPALVPWALSDIIASAGILSLMLGSVSRQPIWFILGGSLLALAAGLMWKAARSLDAKPAPTALVLAGIEVVLIAKAVPGLRDVAQSLSLSASAAYALAGTTSLWLSRNEGLPARWPLIAFMMIHAAVLLSGAVSMLNGAIGQEQAPPVFSLFGLIHFEANIFAIGTAVFILALVKERKEAASRLAASIDGLTGIANRTAFLDSARRIVERCKRDDAPVSAMMFDLDLFKGINDIHGHAVGDGVLRKFCEVAAKVLRPNDAFGRLGGEEFAVVLPGSSIEAAHARAERIRANFAEACRFIADRELDATVSGGVSTSEHADHPLELLLDHADTALYRAKAAGRNRIELADQPRSKDNTSNVLRVA